jgi:signal transduction histidine kinase
MLQAIIRNLVSNATKFTPKGGQITISARSDLYHLVEISINDNGIGMSSSIVDGLFRLDVNTSRKGTEGEASTGLGLIICKEFVEKNGGNLWVESQMGKGSTFYFTIRGNNS